MNVQKIISMKSKEKITMLTAYDYLTAKILEETGIDIILVGDSLGNVVSGYKSTIPVTMDEMIHHAKAVRSGAPQSMIIVDMPFLSYGISLEDSTYQAGRLLKETGANAVKLEGGSDFGDTIGAMVRIGIPVMGHIGLKPQSVNKTGFKIAGKTDKEIEGLILDAKAIEEAGGFSILIEETTEEASKAVTESVSIPTIGIGAGKFTDGQVLVITDMLGINKDFTSKHTKVYANLHRTIKKAVNSYQKEVKTGIFPSEEQIFHKNI